MLSMPAAQYIRQGGMTRPRRLDDVMCTGFGASEASAVASEWISCTNSGRHLVIRAMVRMQSNTIRCGLAATISVWYNLSGKGGMSKFGCARRAAESLWPVRSGATRFSGPPAG